MFNGKKIKELEERVNALETRVHELNHAVAQQGTEIDKLYALFANQSAAKVQDKKPSYRHRPKKNNGKENPTTEN